MNKLIVVSLLIINFTIIYGAPNGKDRSGKENAIKITTNENETESEDVEKRADTIETDLSPQFRDDETILDPTGEDRSSIYDQSHLESQWREDEDYESKDDKNKKKKKPKKKHKKKNPLEKFLPLLLIPFIIQAKIIPLFLLNLKFIALKALLVGKLAMLLVGFNMLRNMMITNHAHVDHVDTKYTMDHLAQDHYGYNGSPEYGSWVNHRRGWTRSAPQVSRSDQFTSQSPKTNKQIKK